MTVATPKAWETALSKIEYVREHGVDQFINNYKKNFSIGRDVLMYGDELEYGIFLVDHEAKTVKLSLRGAEIIKDLQAKEDDEGEANETGKCKWVPEYGSFMIEAIPQVPYGGFTSDLRRIEANMRNRRARLLSVLQPNEIAPSVVNFPRMGVGNFAGDFPNNGKYAASRFVPDEVINPHPRFWTLTQNIRKRRGENVKIMVPLFDDENTDHTPEDGAGGTPGIYMDAMAFGMGCCCLQVTFQARDVGESRHLYDQLAVVAPILLALTAATPIHKGKLADWDARWNIIEDAVDCRTQAERGEEIEREADYSPQMAGGGKRRIPRSRYSGIDTYICNHKGGTDPYSETGRFNDEKLVLDEDVKAKLLKNGVDALLADHIAHLFIRDPLVVFDEHIEIDDETRTDHFENIQSTNWNSVRWKPPPPKGEGDPHIGWRTELRTMEVQFTDYENAAFTVFAVLLSRALLSFDLNLYIPISKNHQNMETAHARDSVNTGKFWFRSHMAPPVDEECSSHQKGNGCCNLHSNLDQIEQMTCSEILQGRGNYFPGLLPLILAYTDMIGCDGETKEKVASYMDFIAKRASGELMTPATWIRNFVTTHPDYKQDSLVSELIAYDLMVHVNDIGLGRQPCPDILGDNRITKIIADNAYNVQLARVDLGSRLEVGILLNRYAKRAAARQQRKAIEKKIRGLRREIADLEAELVALNAGLDPDDSAPALPYSRSRIDSETVSMSPTRGLSRDSSPSPGKELSRESPLGKIQQDAAGPASD